MAIFWNLKTLKEKYNLNENLVLDTTVLIQIIEKVGIELSTK